MANASVASSARHRNSILKIFSANSDFLSNGVAFLENPPPYSLHELDVLIGLAFAAIMVEGKHVEESRLHLNVFLDHRHYGLSISESLIAAINIIFKNGFSAFKWLGFPFYFDDFLEAYQYVLKTTNQVSPRIKIEMQRILVEELKQGTNQKF